MRTLGTLLKKGKDILEKSKIREAGLDAWLLLEYATGKNRAYYFAHEDEAVPDEQAAAYLEYVQRRAARIPLQHITHQAFFMGYEFYVNEHVLIPRQDTEILVEECLGVLADVQKPRILDMCTGSGCILLSLLMEKEEGTGVGVDISPRALAAAKKNAERLGVASRADFVKSDIFSAPFFHKKDGNEAQEYDILISNPPYIPTEDIGGLMDEVRLHDPRLALDGHGDGLYFYRAITEKAGECLKRGGWLFYEIGCEQGGEVSGILKNAGFTDVEIKKDLAGLDRVVLGRLPLQQKKGIPLCSTN